MRKRRMGFWLLWGLALCGIAGCSASPAKNKGMLYGALAGGALGIGAGYAIGANCCGEDSDSKAQGGVIGAAAGALIGATLGYLLAEDEVQAQVQAPPPPPPAPRPAPPAPPAEPKKIVCAGSISILIRLLLSRNSSRCSMRLRAFSRKTPAFR